MPPEIKGAIMAVITAVLRVIYDDTRTSFLRIFLESCLCGALSLTASSGIVAAGLNPEWSVFAGGIIGYLGSTTIRALALKVIKAKAKKL